MENLQLGRIVSSFNVEKIGEILLDLKKNFKGIRIEWFKAKMPLSMTFGKPSHEKKCVKEKANYAKIYLKNKLILEFYGTKWFANGHIFQLSDKLLEILARHHVYTFKTFKQICYPIRIGLIFTSYLLATLGVFLFISSIIPTVHWIMLLLSLIIFIYSVFLAWAYVR